MMIRGGSWAVVGFAFPDGYRSIKLFCKHDPSHAVGKRHLRQAQTHMGLLGQARGKPIGSTDQERHDSFVFASALDHQTRQLLTGERFAIDFQGDGERIRRNRRSEGGFHVFGVAQFYFLTSNVASDSIEVIINEVAKSAFFDFSSRDDEQSHDLSGSGLFRGWLRGNRDASGIEPKAVDVV